MEILDADYWWGVFGSGRVLRLRGADRDERGCRDDECCDTNDEARHGKSPSVEA
jgi:hypothetical protein